MGKFKRNGNKNGNGDKRVKYNPDLFPKQALVACTEMGATTKVLAKLFDVSESGIEFWLKKHPEFKEAVKQGKENHDNGRVINALLRSAIGYEYEELKVEEIELTNGRGKNKVTVPAVKKTITYKQTAPNPVSIIYWLNNRDRQNWKNYKAVEITGNINQKRLDLSGKLEDISKFLSKEQLEQFTNELRDSIEGRSEPKRIGSGTTAG